MENLNSIEQKSLENDYTKIEATEELFKLGDGPIPEDNILTLVLSLVGIINFVMLIIMFIFD